MRPIFGVLFVLLLAGGCATSRVTVPAPPDIPEQPPSLAREFRAAWVATVANIDWPSVRTLTAEQQRAEMRTLLDQAVALGLNAVILQVRPMADAMYPSALEPWSIYLTGEQGRGPGYDPLRFAIDEAHRRGLELHAWFNPFRAGHPTNEGPYDSLHVSIRKPEWVKEYGELLWMDPGVEAVRQHSLDVITDVVNRYDVDGVHLDDYFYPYAIRDDAGADVPFPDSTSRREAVATGDSRTLADWRRSNVNTFVEALYGAVKAAKPWVKVGISPFGIWRPGHPEGVTGFDQYEGLYADARLWLNEGWVDYFTPQLYWAIDSEGQPYEELLDWWIGENTRGRHMWPGNYASRVILEGAARWGPDEIARQVVATRLREGADGNVHFSMRALMPGPGADTLLASGVYEAPALVPETAWLGGRRPGVPHASVVRLGGVTYLRLRPGSGDAPFVWHVRERYPDGWRVRAVPAWQLQIAYRGEVPLRVVVSAVSRLGLEGSAAHLPLTP